MLFQFLKYIKPTWYYNISTEVSRELGYFIDYRELSSKEQEILDIEIKYNTEKGMLCDAAYQAWHLGFMCNCPGNSIHQQQGKSKNIHLFEGCTIKVNNTIIVDNIADNYRFIRRFFNPLFGTQILLTRLLSFHNPIKELYGFFSTIKVKRVDLYAKNAFAFYKNDYENFQSSLISRNPKISVIIPTLNRYEYLKDVLSDLEKQDYKNFEVIVCDQSEPYNKEFYENWNLDLKIIRQQEKALWLARNKSIKKATGEYIALYDDDSLIESNWITQHLKCLDYFKCDISSGVSLSIIGAKIPPSYSFFKWSDQIDTGNVLFAKSMMQTTGMFDRQFEKQRQGDGEYGLRAYLCGKRNVSNPCAKRIHLKVASGGLRQMGSWDGLRPTKLFAPRPVPSILYSCRKYFGNAAARLMLLTSIPTSLMPYKYKGKRKMELLSIACFLIAFPIILTQVIISWRLATVKLKEGDKIEKL